MELEKNVSVLKGDKCYVCTLHVVEVRGGKQVVYVTDDGTVIKREPYFRYNEKVKRRKEGSKGYTTKA